MCPSSGPIKPRWNREVFTVPARTADVRIKGTNRLIRNGAVLVGRTEHVLQAIEPLS